MNNLEALQKKSKEKLSGFFCAQCREQQEHEIIKCGYERLSFLDPLIDSITEEAYLAGAQDYEENMQRQTDAYEYLGTELHIFVRSVVNKIVLVRNGERFEFDLPFSALKEKSKKFWEEV